ncbi:oligosaccharide flippase family protein [Nocardioides sp.]|uniref:oligosaccharide flippase family protein n=1 Tax=Nocardioides sp. TaxID=35761 RepID=UPI003563D83F
MNPGRDRVVAARSTGSFQILWSLWERTLLRGTSGGLALVAAWFVTPADLGHYSVAIAFLTLGMAVTDISLRQLGVIVPKEDLPGIAAIARRIALATVPLNLLATGTLLASGAEWDELAKLLPLYLVPFMSARGSASVAQLQRNDDFRTVARIQGIAATISLLGCLPLLLALGDILALSLQFLATEAIAAHLFRRKCRVSPQPKYNMLKRLSTVAVPNVAAWVQSQSERIAIVLVTDASTVGAFGFAAAIGRLGNDVVTAGIVNYFRPILARHTHEPNQWRRVSMALIYRVAAGSSIASALIIAGNFLLLGPALDPAWGPAVALIPAAAASVGLSSMGWVATTLLVVKGEARRVWRLQAVGIALVVPVAFSSVWGVPGLAVALVGRELVMVPVRVLSLRKLLTQRELLTAWVAYLPLVALACLAAYAGTTTS